MGAEMEDGEVLVCSLVSEKSGSWDCVWERQITLDLEGKKLAEIL